MVLEGLKSPRFEPLQGADLKLLLALASAKRVSTIHALSVHSSFKQLFADNARMILKPNPAFVFNVIGSFTPIDLAALPAALGEQRAHVLCLVRVQCTDRTGFGPSGAAISSLSPGLVPT